MAANLEISRHWLINETLNSLPIYAAREITFINSGLFFIISPAIPFTPSGIGGFDLSNSLDKENPSLVSIKKPPLAIWSTASIKSAG